MKQDTFWPSHSSSDGSAFAPRPKVVGSNPAGSYESYIAGLPQVSEATPLLSWSNHREKSRRKAERKTKHVLNRFHDCRTRMFLLNYRSIQSWQKLYFGKVWEVAVSSFSAYFAPFCSSGVCSDHSSPFSPPSYYSSFHASYVVHFAREQVLHTRFRGSK